MVMPCEIFDTENENYNEIRGHLPNGRINYVKKRIK